jgi:hypothetical protein
MGLIINPRGTSGSGKTELVRRILAEYGWRRGGTLDEVQPLFWPRRKAPFAYRLQHPLDGRPLIVLGHYGVTSGGCDTIRVKDGGLAEAARLADEFATSGYDVLLEGLRLSSDVELSRKLAASDAMHVLLLTTPIDECVRNLIGRRRAGRARFHSIKTGVLNEHTRVQQACERLRPCVRLDLLGFEQAFTRAKELLGLQGGLSRGVGRAEPIRLQAV